MFDRNTLAPTFRAHVTGGIRGHLNVRFPLDHCVPNRVVVMLADAVHEVVRLRDCLPPDSTDPVVLQKATELQVRCEFGPVGLWVELNHSILNAVQ